MRGERRDCRRFVGGGEIPSEFRDVVVQNHRVAHRVGDGDHVTFVGRAQIDFDVRSLVVVISGGAARGTFLVRRVQQGEGRRRPGERVKIGLA